MGHVRVGVRAHDGYDEVDHARFECDGVVIDALTPRAAVRAVLSTADPSGGRAVHLCNAYTLSLALRDPHYRATLDQGHLRLPDGMPLIWVARRLGIRLERRVYGPTLMLDCLDEGIEDGVRHLLYGSTPQVIAALEREIASRFPGVDLVGAISPPFHELGAAEESAMLDAIRRCDPDVVWVGTGTPRQDEFAARASQVVPCTFVAVGAAFDFIAGARRQAPSWIQNSGLEWLHRLVTDPRRMWKRYLVGNVRFVAGMVGRRPRLISSGSTDG